MSFKNIEEINEFFESNEKLSNQFPIEFDTDSVVDRLSLNCPKCKTDLYDHAHGKAVFSLNKTVLNITAVASCHKCSMYVPYDFRVRGHHSEKMSTERINRDGKWVKQDFRSEKVGKDYFAFLFHKLTMGLFR